MGAREGKGAASQLDTKPKLVERVAVHGSPNLFILSDETSLSSLLAKIDVRLSLFVRCCQAE
jgi:hypothetical protein